MEQSLIDKIKQDKVDEIDKDMITARVRNAIIKIMEECTNSVERIRVLLEEYSVEAKMAGISCIFLAQCEIFHEDDGKSDVGLIVGSASKLDSMIEHIKGDLKG